MCNSAIHLSRNWHGFASPGQSPASISHRSASSATAAGLLLSAALAGWAGTASAGSVTFDYTGSAGSWTVPAGVTSIDVVAVGGGGGGGAADTLNSGASGGSGAMITIADVDVTAGSTLSYFVGGGGSSSESVVIAPPTGGQAIIYGGGGGGGSTTLGALGGLPWLIAGGGGGGSGGGSTIASRFGGDGCGVSSGGGGSSPLLNRAGGIGGVGGDYGLPNSISGGDGYGGSGGAGGGYQALGTTGTGYGGSGGAGNGIGTGGDGSHTLLPMTLTGVSAYYNSGGGGGGGYGGGGGTVTFGGGAGGSLWPGMTATTTNSPICVPASNNGTSDIAGGNGSLTITWADPPLPPAEPEAAAVPALHSWALGLLGLVLGAVGLRRLSTPETQS